MLATLALPLLAASLLDNLPPRVEVALARRSGTFTAELTLRQADPRLTALCFDPVGYEPEQVAQARRALLGQRIWLYLGPRRVAQGTVQEIEVAPDPFGPCAVEAKAQFDDPVPLQARSDVLWASTERHDSSPRAPAARHAAEDARLALEPRLAEACLQKTAVNTRGTRHGTYVGLVCPLDDGELSAVVRLPADGAPKVVLLESGRRGALSLIEVLDPGEQVQHRLVLARERPEGRRLELWSTDGETARPLESELLFLQRLEQVADAEIEEACPQ